MPTPTPSIRQSILAEADLIRELLDRATLALHNKGVMQWDLPWDKAEILTPISAGYCYSLHLGPALAGTFLLHPPLSQDEKRYTLSDPDCLYLSRIALSPELQGHGLGREITAFAQEQAAASHNNLYLDCWAGNQKLKAFYTATGFQHLGDQPEDDYMVSLFRFSARE